MQTPMHILITGANRGLGLGYVAHYAALGHHVYATARDLHHATELQALAAQYPQIKLYPLDAASPEAITQLAQTLADVPMDLLISNAGTYPKSHLAHADMQAWLTAFQVNTLATYYLAQAFLPHFKRASAPKLVAMTSKMGSVADNTSGGSYIYRSSKAALNMVVKSLAIDLANEKVTIVVLHPGWVRTEMGGPDGLIDVATSIQGLTQVIAGLTPLQSGHFYDYTGKALPW